jgi:CO/xanthine dehydrogenase Mo-binding subunit
VTIGHDGGVTLSSAVLDVGPGAYTIMRQIVAEELKVPIDAVRVEMLDTTKVRTDSGVRGSSSTRVHGGAAYEAGRKGREEVIRIAAESMACRPDELILHAGGVIHGRMEKRMTFAEIVRANGSPIVAEGHYANMKEGPESSMVAQVAEIEVDEETGEIRLRQLTTAHSVGVILNPITHQGQIDGGVVMGLGYGLMEEMVLESGKVATAHWGDYKIPTLLDIPSLKTALLQSDTGSGPYHSMSIGETALMPTAAAIANAVEDAVGKRIRSLPLGAEKILWALKSG